jgi:HlyD family secretion protein
MTTSPETLTPPAHEPPQHQVPDDLLKRLSTLDEPVTVPSRPKRSWTPVIFGVIILGILCAGGYWGYQRYNQPEGPPKNLETQALAKGDVTLTFVEKGELEAARNTEIICQVRASGRGSTAASSIKWVIDDGSRVKKGDLLMLLEDASLREQLNNQHIVVEEKNDLYEQAKAQLKITENENKSAELTAISNFEIAKIDLEKYMKAEKQQKQFDIESRIKLANADLMQWRDKLGWSNRMFIRGYLSANQKLNDETRLDKASVDLDKLSKEQDTLNFDNKRMEIDLLNKLEQAQLAVEIAKSNSESKRAQAQAKLTSADLILKQETQKRDDLEQDVRNCRITAPHEGMVIYFVPESSRFGGSSQTSTIEVGAPV